MKTPALESSTFQKRPAYQYIRQTDRLPTLEQSYALADDQLIAKVKLFDPTGSWTWFIVAYDPETRTAYGLVDGFEKEVGNIDMREVVAIRGRFGLPVERDLYFTPRPMFEILRS